MFQSLRRFSLYWQPFLENLYQTWWQYAHAYYFGLLLSFMNAFLIQPTAKYAPLWDVKPTSDDDFLLSSVSIYTPFLSNFPLRTYQTSIIQLFYLRYIGSPFYFTPRRACRLFIFSWQFQCFTILVSFLLNNVSFSKHVFQERMHDTILAINRLRGRQFHIDKLKQACPSY